MSFGLTAREGKNSLFVNFEQPREFGLESDVRTPLLEGGSASVSPEELGDGYEKESGSVKDFEGQNRLCEAVMHAWKLILGRR